MAPLDISMRGRCVRLNRPRPAPRLKPLPARGAANHMRAQCGVGAAHPQMPLEVGVEAAAMPQAVRRECDHRRRLLIRHHFTYRASRASVRRLGAQAALPSRCAA